MAKMNQPRKSKKWVEETALVPERLKTSSKDLWGAGDGVRTRDGRGI